MDRPHKYSEIVYQLFNNQYNNWPLMANNYDDLGKIKIKKLEFSDYYLKVQFNPARIKSSSAKTDQVSIENRACFLCSKNRPIEQETIEFEDVFLILINPFPIFPKHLTIINQNHVPQLIKDNFKWMLKLAEALSDFTIFYNGPRCGASAPDHFHFQAGNKNCMPLDYQIEDLKLNFGKLQIDGNCKVWKINDFVRKFVMIESKNAKEIETIFIHIYENLLSLKPIDDEPDLNIHCSYGESGWRVLLFPRGQHRPWQFYAEGEENILFSPASVDLGGLLILPLEKDFEKINKDLASDMIKQIGPDEKLFNGIGFK
jgi:ATP adenylyltransferase/5',5'''-P-1,P-4-tetraphosphate phosphorylase II